jgi:hypothetical protein
VRHLHGGAVPATCQRRVANSSPAKCRSRHGPRAGYGRQRWSGSARVQRWGTACKGRGSVSPAASPQRSRADGRRLGRRGGARDARRRCTAAYRRGCRRRAGRRLPREQRQVHTPWLDAPQCRNRVANAGAGIRCGDCVSVSVSVSVSVCVFVGVSASAARVTRLARLRIFAVQVARRQRPSSPHVSAQCA